MSAPWALDLCSGVGGTTKGLQRAGFRVLGVDIAPQPNYCGDDFHQGDALAYVLEHGHKFAASVAGWPCQAACTLTRGTNKGRRYPQLIPAGRELMRLTGRPWVIENVTGAPIRRDLTLCGEMFGLDVIRHRHFEAEGVTLTRVPHKAHRGRVRGWRHGEYHDGPYLAVYGDGGGKGSVGEWQRAMGIDWTTSRLELAEAIPPAYAEHIGRDLMWAIS